MRLAAVVLAAAVAVGVAHAAGGGPTCSQEGEVAGDVGSFLRVETCRPNFASADRYRPARFRVVDGALPPGLTLWGDGGVAARVDGVPLRVGTYRFTIAATDAAGRRTSAAYTVRIDPRLALKGGALRSGPAAVDRPYWSSIAASGGRPPYSYAGSPAAGLALDRTTGAISGTLRARRGAPPSCPFRVGVTDANGVTTSALYWVRMPRARGAASCAFPGGGLFTWVQGISPRRGPIPTGPSAFVEAAPVTITGRGLRNVTQVSFAGVPAVFRVDSDRRITAFQPPGARTGSILLRTGDGVVRNAGIYRVFFAG